MRVTSLRAWHWMLIGLLAGLAGGAVRSLWLNFSDELTKYGDIRITQRQFERAIVSRYAGRRGFTNIVVYPYALNGASANIVKLHVVQGLYSDGQIHDETGKRAYVWKPAYFVASVPFRSVGTESTDPHLLAKESAPDVMVYMAAQAASGGVQFQYASWWWVTRPLFLWPAVSFWVIGVVWPVIINLLAYGRFTRPPTLKEVLSPQPKLKPGKSVQLPGDTSAMTAQLDRELESHLSPSAIPPITPESPAFAPLSPALLQAVQPLSIPKKNYGAKPEDFYPTELSTPSDD